MQERMCRRMKGSKFGSLEVRKGKRAEGWKDRRVEGWNWVELGGTGWKFRSLEV